MPPMTLSSNGKAPMESKYILAEIGNEGVNLSPVYILAVIAGAGTIIALLFKMVLAGRDREHNLLLAQKDAALMELDSLKKGYQEIAGEAIKSAMDTANYYRSKDGKPPIDVAAPVISESHSPSTQKQREMALVQTMRATMAQIKVASGQAPRVEPEHAIEADPPIAGAVPSRIPVAAPNITLLDAVNLKDEIARVPEKTAEKVVEKIKESEHEQ